MSEWYWSLHGWDLVEATICIVVGVVGAVSAAVIGLASWVGKGITNVARHDQKSCYCRDCQRRRHVAADKRREAEPRGYIVPMSTEPPTHPEWMSTAQLQTGDGVSLTGKMYRVTEVNVGTKGYVIGLRNVQTNRVVAVTVSFRVADQRIWQPLRRWGSSDSHNPGM